MQEKIMHHYKQIRNIVSEDVWQRIALLQPKTKVEFSCIYGMGPVTMERIAEHITYIENAYIRTAKSDLDPYLKQRIEILRDRLINVSQRNNIIWNTKETSNRLIDLSKLTDETIQQIYKLMSNPRKKVELNIEGLDTDENKKVFISIFRENERQKMEKGRSILYVAPALFLGKTRVENKDIKLRAPLFLFPVELTLDKNNDKWYLSLDHGRDVVTNPFVERYILTEATEYTYDLDATLIENIDRLSKLGKKIANQFTKLQPLTKVTTKDPWGYNKGEFAITNNLLLGLFSDFSNEIEAELDSLIYNMDSTPMLTRFLSNEDFHSRHEKMEAFERVEQQINNDSDLSYTNKLNEQQLRALKLINQEQINGLTVWGPPGTGKSETIISIIENAIAKGQKIAVVSEKQAALDVIKDRLKDMKDNSIMISDTKDKLNFFGQLSKMISRDFYVKDPALKKVKADLNRMYKELDDLYAKFGFNNKNIFEQVEQMFVKPLYETPLSKRMQYEDQFYNFKNINLETFDTVFNFIESIDSRERLKLLITTYNNYYGKFKSFSEIEDFVADKIRAEIEKIRVCEELIANSSEIETTFNSFKGLGGFFKKASYKKSLNRKYNLNKQDYLDITLGTFADSQRHKIKSSNEYKDNLINELEWIEQRRRDIDLCLAMDNDNLKLLALIDIDDIHESKEAIKINLIRRLFKSEQFADKMDVLRNYESKVKEINSLQEQFTTLSSNEVKSGLDKSLENVTLNKRENNISKIANRKRPMAIRKFMHDYAIEMRNLVNIWLLQPEVIPALFDITDRFDLVIFDEASQVFLERSLPAIARAKNLVVLGDEKQLGPSSFFAGRITSEDKEDEILEENESLLTYSRSKLPEVMLKKHYRSKDINLIRFSNDRYYEGGLDFINDNNYSDESVSYEFIDNSDYSDGLNKAEADRVIELLNEHRYKDDGNTIGVITANQKQEVYIFNQLITKHYDLFEWLKENNAFIKSIENVQGDERDIIILSTTYGPENGQQRMNFGPINQALGSNRINVAITRAKKKMVIVSSIDLEQASEKMTGLLHQGPKDFIDYIKFAKQVTDGQVEEIQMKESTFSTIFKNEVMNVINRIINESIVGIRTNYEGLGYTLDVVLYDKETNKNLITILLDSPNDSRLAREKDYLAQEFLESRGWKVHRIWSPNWWTRNNQEISTLEEIVESFNINKEVNQYE